MLRALNTAIDAHGRAVLIGADCPVFTPKHLLRALLSLGADDIVLTPAEDGGYVLIGARRTHDRMFDNIDWGTASVFAQQHTALAACGLSAHELETLWDVDRPADLVRLKDLRPPLAYAFVA